MAHAACFEKKRTKKYSRRSLSLPLYDEALVDKIFYLLINLHNKPIKKLILWSSKWISPSRLGCVEQVTWSIMSALSLTPVCLFDAEETKNENNNNLRGEEERSWRRNIAELAETNDGKKRNFMRFSLFASFGRLAQG